MNRREAGAGPPRARGAGGGPVGWRGEDAPVMEVEDLGGGSKRAYSSHHQQQGLPASKQRPQWAPNGSTSSSSGGSGNSASSGGLHARASDKGPSAVPRRNPLEAQLGVEVWDSAGTREAYLYNVTQTLVHVNASKEKREVYSGVNLYFVCSDGTTFRTTLLHRPHFIVAVKRTKGLDCDAVASALGEVLSKYNVEIDRAKVEDLADSSHLARFGPGDPAHACDAFGALKRKRDFLRVSFRSVRELVDAKQDLRRIANSGSVRTTESLLLMISAAYRSTSNRTVAAAGSRRPVGFLLRQNAAAIAKAAERGGLKNAEDEGDEASGIHGDPQSALNLEGAAADATVLVDEIYESDVLYVTRCCIDLNIRCGRWYRLTRTGPSISDKFTLEPLEDATASPPLGVLAYDIECYKQPLKFPDKESDPIILVSYVHNQQGYLLVNREFLSADIIPFVFQPKPELSGPGSFVVFNEPDEKALLKRFISHVAKLKPHILATYNGDSFDMPYVIRRAQLNGLDFSGSFGLSEADRDEAVVGSGPLLHLDCFKWVERDSYLPQGSRTLKAVCKAKLRFNPVEVDPEEMVPLAREHPQRLAVYSVSDAVATYYLYEQFIHSFVLALSSIIPMNPEMVLRQGSGTLCENLLMAEAFARGVLFPNKHQPSLTQYWKDPTTQKLHLVFDESYVGGSVESLKCGIDLEETFMLSPRAYASLLSNVDSVLSLWLASECRDSSLTPASFLNWEENVKDIKDRLAALRDSPVLKARPLLLHLDVAAMYPNIILTHRLQPPAIKTQQQCRECPWFDQEKGAILSLQQDLQTRMHDVSAATADAPTSRRRGFRGSGAAPDKPAEKEEASDASTSESDPEMREAEKQKAAKKGAASLKSWNELTERQKHAELVKATKKYCQRAHKKTKILKEVDEESIVCQRENPFYVETVRAFRDRRYIFKKRLKAAEALKETLEKEGGSFQAKKDAADAVLLNDSLQLAHKCILNSFYGYVKREGARWYSMEMGAVVTKMGADIIRTAKEMVDSLGVTMELDTDGIWCLLPCQFPLRYSFTLKDSGKSLKFEYPTWVLNTEVNRHFSNPQYLAYNPTEKRFDRKTTNEVFFELDGPWKAMFLPASEKSDDLLKKRYVVYGNDGRISELKGFELKRRGELEFIREFQRELFPVFIKGESKQEAYALAAAVGNRFRYLLLSRGAAMQSDAVLERLLVARKVLGKSVAKQTLAKSMSITTAKRLAELLNNNTYLTEAPVSTQYVVMALPAGAEKTSRAVPVQLLHAPEKTKQHYLQKWLQLSPSDAAIISNNIKQVVDWEYYAERLDVQLQKIITIPALKQGLQNPIPGIDVPAWLQKQQAAADPRQQRLEAFFKPQPQQQEQQLSRSAEKPSDQAAAAAAAEAAKAALEEKKQQQQQQLLQQQKQKQQQHEREIQQRRAEALMFKQDFTEWVAAQRVRWKRIREELRVQQQQIQRGSRRVVPSMLLKAFKGNKLLMNSVEALMRASGIAAEKLGPLLSEPWHVLEFYRRGHDRGLYTVHFTTPKSSRFFAVPFQVYRHLYVNSTTPFACTSSSSSSSSSSSNGSSIGDSSGTSEIKVKPLTGRYTLPRGLQQLHLLELEIQEEVFQQQKESITASFHQRAAGIFEKHLPLEFAFLSRMGHVMEAHTTELTTVFEPSGVFSSRGFSRASEVGFAKPLRTSLSTYLNGVSPLIVHIFHGTRGAPKGGPPKSAAGIRDDCDRIFCAVYEPTSLHAQQRAAKGGPQEAPQESSGGRSSFFFGGSVGRGAPNPCDVQKQLVEEALRKQQQLQQKEQQRQEEELLTDDEDTEDDEPGLFSNSAKKGGPHEAWLSTEPAELEAFQSMYPLWGCPCHVFSSSGSSSSSSSSSAATAAAIARSQKKDITQTLRALENYLFQKQQAQGGRSEGGGVKKHVLLLFSTLPASELGAWASASDQSNSGKTAQGPLLSIPVVQLPQVPKRLCRLSRASFAEVCMRESQLLLLQQQQLFDGSLWISRLLCCPLGFVLRGLSIKEDASPDSFLDDAVLAKGGGAQHADVSQWRGPLGARETFRFLYDTFFAQMLRAQRGVLWGSGSSSSSSSIGGKAEVGLCLREKDPDLGCPGLTASAYADFDLLEQQKPTINPGVYRAICYALSLGDSLIFNSVRLADKVDPEFVGASDWLRKEGGALAAAAADAAADAEADAAAAAAAELAAAEPLPAADKALGGFTSPTQFAPAAFRVLGFALQRLFLSLFLLAQKGAPVGAPLGPSLRLLQGIPEAFYSWVCDRKAILFDPALKQRVQRQADLYLSLLLKELSGPFGFEIISADARAVLLSTGVIVAPVAQQQLQQALQQLQHHPLFDAVVVAPSDCFVAVLQLDAKDWVGYREFVPFEVDSSNTSSSNSSSSGEGVKDCLGALRCIPGPLAAFLRATIDRVLQLPLLQLLHRLNEYADDFCVDNNTSSGNRTLSKDEIAVKLAELAAKLWFAPGDDDERPTDGKENLGGALKSKKPKTFFGRLKRFIKDPLELIRKYGSSRDIQRSKELAFNCLDFPHHLGSRWQSGSWRFLAVQFISRLMQIDRNIDFSQQSWAQALAERRHELYTIADESDAKANKWISPLRSLWVRDLHCSSCACVQDVDLVAAMNEVVEETPQGEQLSLKICKCPSCGVALDDDVLEAHLLRALQDLHYAYLAQDLYCTACHAVCVTHLRDKCKEFVQTTQEFALEMGFETLQCCLIQLQEAWS
ncbi:hypothetical protein Emed_001309 [Eimeria media]